MRKKNCQRPQRLRKILKEAIGSDSFSDIFYNFFLCALVFMTPPSIWLLVHCHWKSRQNLSLYHKVGSTLRFDPYESILLSSLRCAMVNHKNNLNGSERFWLLGGKKKSVRYLGKWEQATSMRMRSKSTAFLDRARIISAVQMGRVGWGWTATSWRTFLPLSFGLLLINGALSAAANGLHLYPSVWFSALFTPSFLKSAGNGTAVSESHWNPVADLNRKWRKAVGS